MLNSNKPKPSTLISIDDEVKIKQGSLSRTIIVMALTDKRGPAKLATHLYKESDESISNRKETLSRNTKDATISIMKGRPTKRHRRILDNLKRRNYVIK